MPQKKQRHFRWVASQYWNHNAAYHREALRRAQGDVLDVGCGDGFFTARLARVSVHVTGIDSDERIVSAAARRLNHLPNVSTFHSTFAEYQAAPSSFDAVFFIASLHHMDPVAALNRARELVRVGGTVTVIGLARDRSTIDRARSLMLLPLVRMLDLAHGGRHSPRLMKTVRPTHSLAEVRAIASDVLPGARIRRGIYYRYVLTWTRRKRSENALD